MTLAAPVARALAAPMRWQGVDESVVARIAAEAGRRPRRPFVDTDQGDLLLFAFLGAGIVGGFALGYYYRVLFVDRAGVTRVNHAGVTRVDRGDVARGGEP